MGIQEVKLQRVGENAVDSSTRLFHLFIIIIGASLSEPHTNGTYVHLLRMRGCAIYAIWSLSIVRRAIIHCRLL